MNERFRTRLFHIPTKTMIYEENNGTQGKIDIFASLSLDGKIHDYMQSRDEDVTDQFIRMQCTGLKDKNGNLIYEGDKVEGVNCYCGNEKYPLDKIKQTVEWHGCGFNIGGDTINFEIIGNIHENRELLDE